MPLGATARVLAVALASAILMLTVALLASGGFTGGLRYVALPMALLCVLSGIGWAWLARRVPAPVIAVAALAALPGLVSPVDRSGDNLARIADDRPLLRRAARLHRAPRRPRRGDGAAARSTRAPFYTQALAYRLHTRQQQIGLRPAVPGSVLDSARSLLGAGNRDYALKERGTEWMLRSTC